MHSLPTSTGCHTAAGRRPANQDAVLAATLPDGSELIAVADGLGGHSAGEVASQGALEAVRAGLTRGLSLREAVSVANDVLHAAAGQNPDWAGMGTTLVALLRSGSTYEIANVGDSRAYHLTSVGIRQITTDHSVMAEAVSSGMSAEAAELSRWRHALTRALGTDADIEVDVFGPFSAAEPHAVLLCSDGLYRSIPEDSLRGLIAEAPDPGTAARVLTEEAYRNGSADNITAAVVHFGGRVELSPGMTPVTWPAALYDIFARGEADPPNSQTRSRTPVASNPTAGIELALILVLLTVVIALLVRGS